MIRVDQTITGVGRGNCFAACIACFLHLPVEEVPNFCCIEGDWWADFEEWIGKRGWKTAYVKHGLEWAREHLSVGTYWIAGGICPPRKSGEVGPHVCVYQFDRLWHDPNPERTGLAEVTDAFMLWKSGGAS